MHTRSGRPQPRVLLRVVLPILGMGAAIALIGIAFDVVTIVHEGPVQAGIDAHLAQTTATYVTFSDGGYDHADTFVISYDAQDRSLTARMGSIPHGVKLGDRFCVEYNAERPQDVRACGTQGRLDDARRGAGMDAVLLAGCLLLGGVSLWRIRRTPGRPADARPAPSVTYHGLGDLVIRPHPGTRAGLILIYALGPTLVAIVVIALVGALMPWGLVAGGLGIAAAARIWTLRVRCSDGRVLLAVSLFARRIRAAQVTEVTDSDIPVIWWQTSSGDRHSARLRGFWHGDRALRSIHERHAADLRRLRTWIAANRSPFSGL